jgi:hypothetical protein
MRLMTVLRPLFGFFLGLMLALTSVTMAQARHYGPMGTSVVICANGMAQTITLDANGQKLPFTHVCPDCIMAALDMPVGQSLPQRPNFGKAVALPLPVAAMVQVPIFHAAARGPPVLM